MSVITKDLGVATAYGYAKSKGYTGTEEEFAELMTSYADVAQQAEAAAQDAEDAKDAAVSAKNDAVTAKTAAQAAQSAAETASGTATTKASEAAQSAQSAAGSASAAQTSATAASGSVSTAQTAAQTATNKASEASSSASAASTAKTGAETARTGAQTAQAAAETAQANAEAAASSVSASAAQIEQNTEDIAGLKNDLSELEHTYSAFVVETATGSIASFTDGADDVPVKDLTVAIEPVQSGSGDPSPSNVRPISGWTGANVTRTGKNLWGGEKLKDDILRIVPNSSANETAKTVGYQASFVSEKILFTNFKPNTQYTVILKGYNTSTETQATNLTLVYTDGTEERGTNFIDGVAIIKTDPTKSVKNISGVWSTQTTYLYYNECGVFEGDLTANDFVPYQGNTVSVDWTTEAGTVYGGTLDVTAGVLTVDRKVEMLNGASSEAWSFNQVGSSAIYRAGHVLSDAVQANDVAITANKYKGVTFNARDNTTANITWVYDAEHMLSINVTETTLDAFKASLASTPLQVCYQITPVTYQLTPTEVATILGQNNIFADTGNVTVQYRADTKLYIDKVISA